MKKTFKKFSPDAENIKNHKHLQWLGKYLHINSLWAFNRRTLSRAFAIGLFCTFIPIPFQMVLATIAAIVFYANLPVSIALVWITNPITIPPIFYACYKLGVWLLGSQITQNFDWTLEQTMTMLPMIWQPFLLGCLVVASMSALVGYFSIHLLYRFNIYQYLKNKRNKQQY